MLQCSGGFSNNRRAKMIKELQGMKVTVYLNLSAWGDSLVKGEVIEIKDS